MFEDPVTTPDGITYERAAIVRALRHYKQKDPLTTEALSVGKLAPNTDIADAVKRYRQSVAELIQHKKTLHMEQVEKVVDLKRSIHEKLIKLEDHRKQTDACQRHVENLTM